PLPHAIPTTRGEERSPDLLYGRRMVRDPLRRPGTAMLAVGLLSVSCSGKGATASAESGGRVHPFSEVQSAPVTFEAGTDRPGQARAAPTPPARRPSPR